MPATDFYKKLASELVLKGQGAGPTIVYAGLGATSFAYANDPMSGELSATGYSRIPVQWTDFGVNMTNTALLLWSVVGSWPTVDYVFISGSAQGGTVLLYQSGMDINVQDGDTISIAIGDLILT